MLDKVRVSQTSRPDRSVQLQLCRLNDLRLNPGFPKPGWQDDINEIASLTVVEGEFLEASRARAAERAASAPTDANGFIAWFEELRETGPGQNDALFPWLAAECTMDEMKWFLTQEVAGEAGFDDLTALTQVKLPVRPKLELGKKLLGRDGPRQSEGDARSVARSARRASAIDAGD